MSSVQSVGSTPSGGGFSVKSLVPQNLGGIVQQGTVIGQIGNAAFAGIKGGQAAAGDAGTIVSDIKGFKFDGLFTAMKGLGTTALQFGEKSALVQGGLSLVVNAYRAFTHEISPQEAGARVVGDTATGFVGGAAGAVASGFGMAVLSTFMGLSGGLLTIAGGLIGMGAFFLAEKMFKGSNLYSKIYNGTKGLMDTAFTPLMNHGGAGL